MSDLLHPAGILPERRRSCWEWGCRLLREENFRKFLETTLSLLRALLSAARRRSAATFPLLYGTLSPSNCQAAAETAEEEIQSRRGDCQQCSKETGRSGESAKGHGVGTKPRRGAKWPFARSLPKGEGLGVQRWKIMEIWSRGTAEPRRGED